VSRNERPIHDPDVIAAVHEAGGRWRAVLARREPTGTDGQIAGLRLIEAETFATDTAARRIPEWLLKHQCGRVIGVLPATAAICRTSQLPNGPAERLIPALRLQAEGHLLGDVPPHRIGMGIMPAADGEATRTGVIVVWPTSSSLSDSALAIERGLATKHSWMPETAALAALVDRARPSEPVVWCDRTSGGVAIFLKHGTGIVIRATREENATPEDWIGGVGRVVADTALSVGKSPEDVGTAVVAVQTAVGDAVDGSMLALPPELQRALPGRIGGAPTESAWWQTYGLAVGALIGATGSLAPLADLQRDPPLERPSPLAIVADRLSRPRIAFILAVVAVTLLVVWPVAAASLRLAILRAKAPELREVQRDVDELERRLQMYRALAEHTFPMHKLLADIANSTPDGIEVESLTIGRGEGISVRGVANRRDGRSAEELVLLMSTRMNEGRIFDQTSPSWDIADARGTINFRLNARVPRPYHEVQYAEEWDFGAFTLADRRFGRRDDASTTAPGSDASPPRTDRPVVASDEHAGDHGQRDAEKPVELTASDPPRTPSGRPTGGGRTPTRTPTGEPGVGSDKPTDDALAAADRTGGDQTDASPDSARGSSPAAPGDTRRVGQRGTGEASGAATRGGRLGGRVEEIPPPLSREQIRAMSRAEAQTALAAVSRARLRGDLEPETAERLRDEFDLLLQHTKEAG